MLIKFHAAKCDTACKRVRGCNLHEQMTAANVSKQNAYIRRWENLERSILAFNYKLSQVSTADCVNSALKRGRLDIIPVHVLLFTFQGRTSFPGLAQRQPVYRRGTISSRVAADASTSLFIDDRSTQPVIFLSGLFRFRYFYTRDGAVLTDANGKPCELAQTSIPFC